MTPFHLDNTIRSKPPTGTLHAAYGTLVELLGQPALGTDDGYPNDPFKTDAHWGLMIEGGAEVAIWNYKNGPAYAGTPLERVDTWQVYAVGEVARTFVEELQAEAGLLDDTEEVAETERWTVATQAGDVLLTVGAGDTETLSAEDAQALARALLIAAGKVL